MTREERKEYMKQYYGKNRDKKREYDKEYHKNNKDRIKKRTKEYREKNKSRIKEYYEQNKDKFKKCSKNFFKKNKEYMSVYQRIEKNKIRFSISRDKRRAKCKDSDITIEFRIELEKNTTHCEICGKKFKTNDKKHLDHIIPINIGGTNTRNNVRYVHAKCNLQRPKNGSDIIQFKLAM